MKIYSFDISPIKLKDKLFNIFQKNIEYNNTIQLYKYIVPKEYEMRLDLISKRIYGSPDYIEELMLINNIINPYSIRENQDIYYCSKDKIGSLYTTDNLLDTDELREKIIQAEQPSKNRKKTEKIPTTLKPKNIKQVTIDTKNRKVKIMNSFK